MRGFKVGSKPKAPRSIKSGTIQGPGTGTSDDVKATVAEGSYVMPADSTAQIGAEQLQGMGAPVDVNLSNGEQLMSPEQVHAVGVQTLDAMKNATHVPAALQNGAKGFQPRGHEQGKPELFFADGGLVEEPPKKQASFDITNTQAAQRAAGISTNAEAAQRAAGVTPSAPAATPAAPQPTPAPQAAPRADFYTNSSGVTGKGFAPSSSRAVVPAGPVTGTSLVPVNQPTAGAPNAEAPKASARPEPDYRARAEAKANVARDTAAFQAERAAQDARFEAAKNQPAAPEKAPGRVRSGVNSTTGKGAVGLSVIPALAESAAEDSTARYAQRFGMDEPTGDGSAGDILKFAALRGLGFASDLGNNLTLGLAGKLYRDNQAEQAPGAAAAPAQSAPAPVTPATQASDPYAAPTPTQQPAAQQAAPLANNIIREGNSFSASGPIRQGYTINGEPPPQQPQVGPPTPRSEQNEAAVKALFERTPEFSGANQAGRFPDGTPYPIGAPVIHGAQGFRPGGVTVVRDSGRDEAIQRKALAAASTPYRGSQNGQLTANQVNNLNRMQESAARNATDLAREQMQQDGAYGRTVITEAGANQRFAQSNALDQQRTAADVESKGFANRSAQRIEKLYEQYDQAAPEDRPAIAEQLRVLAGKDKPDQYGTVSLGTEVDPVTGMITNRGDAVFNRSNGQIIGQSAALPPIEQNPQALAIKNNQNLSRDERAKQLRALGYQ